MKTFKKQIVLILLVLAIIKTASAQVSSNFMAISSVKSADVPLDIDFNVTISKNTGELSWSAVSNLDVVRYELEKGADGSYFSYITSVAATGENAQQYHITDNYLNEGISYYRLKVVCDGGSIYFSKPVAVDKNFSAAKFKIMPNIVADELLIWLPVNIQISNATITDVAGRVVMQDAPISNRTCLATLKVAALQTGIYKIRVVSNDGVTSNLSFSKK